MIHGKKESGYYITTNQYGNRIEGEARQCIHCQYLWEYGPNAPDKIHNETITRGYCLKHRGFICCRKECVDIYGLAPNCKSFEEEVQIMKEKLLKGKAVPEMGLSGGDYTITPTGLITKI